MSLINDFQHELESKSFWEKIYIWEHPFLQNLTARCQNVLGTLVRCILSHVNFMHLVLEVRVRTRTIQGQE